jgi:hypothetical protein
MVEVVATSSFRSESFLRAKSCRIAVNRRNALSSCEVARLDVEADAGACRFGVQRQHAEVRDHTEVVGGSTAISSLELKAVFSPLPL